MRYLRGGDDEESTLRNWGGGGGGGRRDILQKVRGARERAREDKKYENEKITNMNEENRKIKRRAELSCKKLEHVNCRVTGSWW